MPSFILRVMSVSSMRLTVLKVSKIMSNRNYCRNYSVICNLVYNDMDVFCEGLLTLLEPGKRVEADNGYIGEAPLNVKCSKSIV